MAREAYGSSLKPKPRDLIANRVSPKGFLLNFIPISTVNLQPLAINDFAPCNTFRSKPSASILTKLKSTP